MRALERAAVSGEVSTVRPAGSLARICHDDRDHEHDEPDDVEHGWDLGRKLARLERGKFAREPWHAPLRATAPQKPAVILNGVPGGFATGTQ